MPLTPRVTACSAVLVAAVALAATGAMRGVGAVAATRVRTVAITPMRIRVLVAAALGHQPPVSRTNLLGSYT